MVEKISDLISMNSHAALIPGVQLEWYGNPVKEAENERLVSNYIFSSGAATQGAASAIAIFERIRDSLTRPDTHNIFTVIAHYGHGKSHFGLVLANYFGRRLGDPVLEKLLNQLEKYTDKNTAYHFRQFKKNVEKPQLVIRLSGHDFTNLRQGFLSALRRALDQHEATRGYSIKAVSERAAKWLRGLSSEQRERAAKWLDEMHHTDFEAFVEKLEQFDTTKDVIARELSREILGIPADFGSDVNLREIIDQVVNDLCYSRKHDAPFYRMVILFDELGQYAEKWCHNRMAAGDLAPQQLTEACDNWKGEVCLVAFLQRHMDSFVKQYGTESEFKKWAGRFPDQTSFRLESSLEKVIGGLLSKQSGWGEFARAFMPQITSASTEAWQMLPIYQQRPQQWSEARFNTIVGVGAFPLHPLTTGLLCNLTFTQGSRTIIGFVDAMYQAVKDKPAALGGKLEWVWPIRLVDEFAGDFADQASFERYEYAKTRLGANSPEHLYQVLKALFLYEVGGIKKNPNRSHAAVLAALCGLPEQQVREALQELDEERLLIQFSRAKGEYEFCGIGLTGYDILQQIQRAATGKTLSSLADKISKLKLIEEFEFPESGANGFKNKYGIEGDEWRLDPVMVDAAKLSIERLRQVIKDHADPTRARGLLVYTVSDADDDLELARSRAASVLNNLRSSQQPYPVVIAVPQNPAVKLRRELLMRDELDDWGQGKRQQYGQSYDKAVSDSDNRIKDELKAHLRSEGIRYFVPSSVEKKLNSHQASQLDLIADQIFEDAFPHRVPAKFHIMKLTSMQGNKAVAAVARHLLTNDVTPNTLQTVEQNLVRSVLHEGPDKWGVLTTRNTIKEPSHSGVRKAWDYLDQTIPEDRRVNFTQLSADLRAMPYGFDDFTLTLLYASWIGKHKNELRFFGVLNSTPQPLSLSNLQNQMDKAKSFIKWLDDRDVQVQHAGRGRRREASNLPEKLRAVTEYEDAVKQVDAAEQVAASLSPDDELAAPIREQIEQLKEEIAKIDQYKKEVKKYCHAAETAERKGRIDDLLTLEKGFPRKPDTLLQYDIGFVKDAKKLFDDLVEQLVIRKVAQKLERIESRDALMRDLESLRNVLHRNGREKLEMECIAAIKRIENEYAALKARQEEEAVVARVETLRVADANLAACRKIAVDVRQILEEELANASERARRQVLGIQEQINHRIASCEEWIAALPEQVAAAVDATQIKALRDEIIKRSSIYANTLEEALLLTYQQQVEAKAEELAKAERQQAMRQAHISAYFGLVKERAARVVQAREFDDAVREFANLQPLPALPDGVLLTEEEEREQQEQLNEAMQRITTLFGELTAAKTPQTATEFERRQTQLEQSIEALGAAVNLPAEWWLQLREVAETNRRAYEDWQLEQRRKEEAQRLAQENERRQDNNRKLVDGALRQAESAQSLREIHNAIDSLSAIRAGLEPPCDEQIEQIDIALRDLGEREKKIRMWVNEVLPGRLASLWTVIEIQELRQEVISYESRCEGEVSLAAALEQARLQLERRRIFLNELAALEENATSISQCHESLRRLGELREAHPDGEPLIAKVSARLQIKQRDQVERWLVQFKTALEQEMSAKDAGALLRKLQDRPEGLEERDEPFLEQVGERLKLTLDRDKVARIVEDFRTLQTAEQRVECLLQIAELCRAEGMPEALANRLASLFEMGAAV